MTTIFTDLCVNKSVTEALRDKSFKVISGFDVGLDGISDSKIFSYVLKNGFVLLTFDQDFGNILRFDIRGSSGVVIVYVEDMTKEEIIKRTLELFEQFKASHLKRKLFIVEKSRIRIWPK